MTSLSRRALLQLAGLAAFPALARADGALGAGAPDADPLDAPDRWAERIHEQAAQRPATIFTPQERAQVAAMADAIIPRTDTIGALDVAVPAWVEFITAEWMTELERTEFREGLAALEAHAVAGYGHAWPALDAVQRMGELDWAALPLDANLPAKRAYRRLRGHVLHGYLTSERVRREVLKVNIWPGRYRGDVPIVATGEAGHAH